MAMRVVLVLPPAIEPVKTPLLAFAYLVAALREHGHDAFVVDAAAPAGPRTVAELCREVARFEPDLIGLHIKTLEAQPAYAAAAELRRAHAGKLVAGGPHASVCAAEALRNGFDFVVRGEAESALPELADALTSGSGLSRVLGLSWVDRGLPRHNADRPFRLDLDALPDPLSALDAFEPAAYGARRTIAPAGLLSSRGCPAACTFCANNVTGRKFRFHSPERVVAEATRLRDEFDVSAFAFFDDSFAVGRARIEKLCRALEPVGIQWTCTAHPSHLDRPVIERMKRAGCGGLDIGLESGDSSRLENIGKGVTTRRALDVLAWAQDLGLHTVVNLMVGWPDESEAELEATLAFIERAAPLAGGFNARGALVPHPGTELYDRYHARFGFSEWWLRETPIPYQPFPEAWTPDEIQRAYASDPALDRNFFRHSSSRLELMRQVLERKAQHTLARLSGWANHGSPDVTVPAAGSR